MIRMIRSATQEDAPAICAIYNPYIRDTTITFEEQEVSVEEMRRRIGDVLQSWLWLVCEIDGLIAGYAYATRWRTRAAYRHSVESTIYMSPGHHRRGLGQLLYSELILHLRSQGVHRVMGGIALPNQPSVALHEKLGFKKVAQFEEVGRKFGRWIDVGYWQLSL
jgi:L-amino acid N-acyltransferase YncA